MTSLWRHWRVFRSVYRPFQRQASQNSLESEYKLASSHRPCLISMHLVCHYSAKAVGTRRVAAGRRHFDLRSGVRLYGVCIFVYRWCRGRPRGKLAAKLAVPKPVYDLRWLKPAFLMTAVLGSIYTVCIHRLDL